jgi:hypothetical protein
VGVPWSFQDGVAVYGDLADFLGERDFAAVIAKLSGC